MLFRGPDSFFSSVFGWTAPFTVRKIYFLGQYGLKNKYVLFLKNMTYVCVF